MPLSLLTCCLKFYRSFFYPLSVSLPQSPNSTSSLSLKGTFYSEVIFLFSWLRHFLMLGYPSVVKQLKCVPREFNCVCSCFRIKGIHTRVMLVRRRNVSVGVSDCGKRGPSLNWCSLSHDEGYKCGTLQNSEGLARYKGDVSFVTGEDWLDLFVLWEGLWILQVGLFLPDRHLVKGCYLGVGSTHFSVVFTGEYTSILGCLWTWSLSAFVETQIFSFFLIFMFLF